MTDYGNINSDRGVLIGCGLVKSDKGLKEIERIIDMYKKIENIYVLYNPDLTIKETSIVGRASTATPVIKTHAIFEYNYFLGQRPLEDLHGATLKAWARKELNEDGKRKDKKMIAEAVEMYYNRTIPEIWGSKGGLIDDVADAIALSIAYKYKNKEKEVH